MIEYHKVGVTQERKMNQIFSKKSQILLYNSKTRSFRF